MAPLRGFRLLLVSTGFTLPKVPQSDLSLFPKGLPHPWPPDSTGARDSLTSMSWLLYQLVYNPACLVVPGGAWMGSCIAEQRALPRPLLVAESRATSAKLVL
ncbi:hypothetical protein TNCV_2849941 [Trichonephila clavipes]|nr:hypothetical protein TNCV_2849941 [Trichonephila clavipes]